jgi:phospholipid N-methyltransferase
LSGDFLNPQSTVNGAATDRPAAIRLRSLFFSPPYYRYLRCRLRRSRIGVALPGMRHPLRRCASALMFLREWAGHPRAMGAVCSSSRKLARGIAELVPAAGSGYVVELGGGTGAVTRALLDAGIPAERLIVIERSEKLAGYLQRTFPQLRILCGDAAQLTQMLQNAGSIGTIVSGLPLFSLPGSLVRTIMREVDAVLAHDGCFIQFTYAFTRALPHIPHSLRRVTSKRILSNLPPARVDAFRRQPLGDVN